MGIFGYQKFFVFILPLRSLSRDIGLRPCPPSRILEGVNPLALQNGHFTQSRMALEKNKTIRILSNLQLHSAAYC